jgi:hypothetical protein
MTSTIKVNTVKDTASTDIIKKCGTSITVGTASDTTTVAGNAVRSNAIQASDGQNIISQVGTTITLGATGDNIVLAGGASQSGFGRTGTVDWQTGSIKTSTFTAANGEGYFANTSGGAFTMNLPAGVVGNIVSVVDYTNTFQTNNLTIAANGTEKIGGIAASIALNIEGQSVTFIYVDATEGWKNTMDSTSNVTGNPFLQASVTGACNTLTTVGDCKVATFTGPGSFVVSSLSQTAPHNVVSYMVVGGGGPGSAGGGGGAGGFREVKTPNTSYTASPLDGYPNAPNRVTVTAASFPITVGGAGSDSVFSTITSARGGGGGFYANGGAGNSGGSGGGGVACGAAGAGNTPPVSPSQGNNGGAGGGQPSYKAGGGGGAGATGGGSPGPSASGSGGAGIATSISGSSVTRAGGGGGSNQNTAGQLSSSGLGGPGGGGGGGATGGPGPTNRPTGVTGTINTGGGGGGGFCVSAGNGGSGIVIIRYKFQ